MDLFAYTQITDLSAIAQQNNITVPRLRGYRLMSDEAIVSNEEIQDMITEHAKVVCHDALEQSKRAIQNQYAVWNKYAGKENVLYIHARIGGNNWGSYGGSTIERQPWFLEKVDDSFDDTYCDIYAKINAPHIETK